MSYPYLFYYLGLALSTFRSTNVICVANLLESRTQFGTAKLTLCLPCLLQLRAFCHMQLSFNALDLSATTT